MMKMRKRVTKMIIRYDNTIYGNGRNPIVVGHKMVDTVTYVPFCVIIHMYRTGVYTVKGTLHSCQHFTVYYTCNGMWLARMVGKLHLQS